MLLKMKTDRCEGSSLVKGNITALLLLCLTAPYCRLFTWLVKAKTFLYYILR